MNTPETIDISNPYTENGYYFPVDVMTASEAGAHRANLEQLENLNTGRKLGNKGQLNHPHVVYQFANEIVRNETLLDAVEMILGPDILLWGSTFFIKEPHTESYVSWHQDLRYWGLADKDAMVSAWLALAPVNQANGCMQFVSGSHRNGLLEHKDSFDDKNFLTRGQEADVEIDEDAIVHVELRPGQASLHHGHLLHSSAPNNSDNRRIGYAINFIAPHNRQIVAANDFAMLVRGNDKYGYFEHVPPPDRDLSDDAIKWHSRILNSQNEAMYEGAGVTET